MALKTWVGTDVPTMTDLNLWVKECPSTIVYAQMLTADEYNIQVVFVCVLIDILIGTYLAVQFDAKGSGSDYITMYVYLSPPGVAAPGPLLYSKTWSAFTGSWVRKTDLKLISGMSGGDGRAQRVFIRFGGNVNPLIRGLTIMGGTGNTIAKYGDSA